MSPEIRRLLGLWLGLGVSGLAIAAIVGVLRGDDSPDFWRSIATVVVIFASAAAAFAGLALVIEHRFRVLGWAVLVAAPIEFVVLMIATWKEHVSELYANGLATAAVFLLSGLLAATVARAVDLRRRPVIVSFVAVILSTLALDGLAVSLIWSEQTSDNAWRALVALAGLAVIGSLLTPLVQRASRDGRPRALSRSR
jgi:hypothetical protein